jgi:hypothetical protein
LRTFLRFKLAGVHFHRSGPESSMLDFILLAAGGACFAAAIAYSYACDRL